MNPLMLLAGKKTYIVAAVMVINELSPFLTGDKPLGDLDFNGILTALGIATLRAGVAKGPK